MVIDLTYGGPRSRASLFPKVHLVTRRAQEAKDRKKEEESLNKRYLGAPGAGEVMKHFVSFV